MNEIWKDIEGYEGLYQVSNLGRVQSVDRLDGSNHRLKGKIRSTSIRPNGYEKVILSKNSKRKGHSVHRLVAQAFIPNPENKPQVNHIDENQTNNMASNLEWSTAKENANHGTRTERIGKTRSIPIIAINIKTGESQEFYGTAECARQLGLQAPSITNVLKGRHKQTGGYTFKYKEEIK